MVIAAIHLLVAAGGKGKDIDIGSIVGYIVVGLIVGLLARFFVPGRDPIGLIRTILLGIVGAVIGGWAAGTFVKETAGVDWIASIVAAMLLILLWRAFSGGRRGVLRS